MKKHGIKRPEAKASEPSTDKPNDFHRKNRVEKTGIEMQNQDEAIKNTLDNEHKNIKEIAKKFSKRDINHMYLIGCGDSWFINIGVRYALESLLGITCEAIEAQDFNLYHHIPVDEKSAVIGISSSGSTSAVINSLSTAYDKGAFVIGVSNTKDAGILSDYDAGLYIDAVREGWPTQASTAAMSALTLLGIEIAKAKGTNKAEAEKLFLELQEIPKKVKEVFNRHNEEMKKLAKELYLTTFIKLTGCGSNYAAAAFGAAKIKELCPIDAEAMHLEEFHHYRTLRENDVFFLVAPDGPSLKRALDTAKVGRYDGGKIYSIVSDNEEEISNVSHQTFNIPEVDERLAPILYSIPLHQFAYHLAMAKFDNNVGYPGSFMESTDNE